MTESALQTPNQIKSTSQNIEQTQSNMFSSSVVKEIQFDTYSFLYTNDTTVEIPPMQCSYDTPSNLPPFLYPTSSPTSEKMPKWCSVPYTYDEIDFHFPTWYNKTIQLINKRWENYVPAPVAAPPASNYKYSKIHVSTFKGITYTTVYNACVEPNEMILELYQDPNEPKDNVKTLRFSHYYPWIQWKKTMSISSTIPESSSFIDEEGIWMMHPLNAFLLSNYVESVNFLVHHLYYPSTLPQIKQMFILNECLGGDWRKNYKYLMSDMYDTINPTLFGNYGKPDILCQTSFRNYMNSKHSYCFKKIYIPGNIWHNYWGGIYTHPSQSNIIRAITYKKLGTKISYNYNQLGVNIVHIKRITNVNHSRTVKNRNIRNIDAIIEEMKNFPYFFHIQSASFESLSFADQVQLMVNTDIILGVVGSGLTNAMYMLPHSAVVAIYTVNAKHIFFTNLAVMSNVYYFPIFNFTHVPDCPNKFIDMHGFYGAGCDAATDGVFYNSDVEPPVNTVIWTLDIARTYVQSYKYSQ